MLVLYVLYLLSDVSAAKERDTIVYVDNEKFILRPLPEEFRTRVNADGSRMEVIPGSVGLGYIVEELNHRMRQTKENGQLQKCLQLQKLCHQMEQRRLETELLDVKIYGTKVKKSQAVPLLCDDLPVKYRETNWTFNIFLLLGAVLALGLYFCSYTLGYFHKPMQSAVGSKSKQPCIAKSGRFYRK